MLLICVPNEHWKCRHHQVSKRIYTFKCCGNEMMILFYIISSCCVCDNTDDDECKKFSIQLVQLEIGGTCFPDNLQQDVFYVNFVLLIICSLIEFRVKYVHKCICQKKKY